MKMRQLAVSKFMENLSRLGVAPVIVLRRLKLGQFFQAPSREGGIDDHILKPGDQAIAPEQGDKPRYAGRR